MHLRGLRAEAVIGVVEDIVVVARKRRWPITVMATVLTAQKRKKDLACRAATLAAKALGAVNWKITRALHTSRRILRGISRLRVVSLEPSLITTKLVSGTIQQLQGTVRPWKLTFCLLRRYLLPMRRRKSMLSVPTEMPNRSNYCSHFFSQIQSRLTYSTHSSSASPSPTIFSPTTSLP